MDDFNINQDEINNIKCNEHPPLKYYYTQYCFTCQKNLCDLCEENHQNHEILVFKKKNKSR